MKRLLSLSIALWLFLPLILAQTVVTTESALRSAVATNNANIQLGADIAISSELTIGGSNNVSVTIDLNGYTLDRGLGSVSVMPDNSLVFYIKSGSTLTIADGSGNNSGTITGGFAYNGGAILNLGTLVFNGGTIIGNRTLNAGGGIFNMGTVTINGGVITGNTADTNGGGIHNIGTLTVNGGTISGNTANMGGGVGNGNTLHINGGTITGNTANSHGGGLWSSYATLNIQGSVTISGNTNANAKADNLYLSEGIVINVAGALTGSTIGVNMEKPGVFTNNYATYHSADDPDTFFAADDAGYGIALLNGEACLSVNYIENSWDNVNKQVVSTIQTRNPNQYTVLTSHNLATDTTFLNDEFYVVSGAVSIYRMIVRRSNVHIILGNNATLSSSDGICVTKDHTLYIHAQSTGEAMGKLRISSGEKASLGATDWEHSEDDPYETHHIKYGGNIVIHGGDIDITAGSKNAAIGGKYKRGNGNITIYSGIIRAEGGDRAAGIGGGCDCQNYGNINIYGGVIEAIGGDYFSAPWCGGPGIGGGDDCEGGALHIYGGNITATGRHEAAGIGSAQCSYDAGAGTIIIDGGYIVARGDNLAAGIGGGDGRDGANLTINGGYVEAYGGAHGAGIGGGEGGDGGTIIINGGFVIAKAGTDTVGNRAFGPGYDSDNYGTLTLSDTLMVRDANGQPVNAETRENTCWYRTQATVQPCTHPNAIYSVSGCTEHDTHTKQCPHCNTVFVTEKHTFLNGVCTVCGTHQSDPTGIEEANANADTTLKYLQNGILFINKNNHIYTITGRKVK